MIHDSIEAYLEARRKALNLPPGTVDPFLLKFGKTEAELQGMSNSKRTGMDDELTKQHRAFIEWIRKDAREKHLMRQFDKGEFNVDTDNPLGGEVHVHTSACTKGGDGTGVWLLVITLGALALGYLIGWLRWGGS